MITKRYRRIAGMVLALLLAAGIPLAATAEMITMAPFQAVQDSIGLQQGTKLTVGSTTPLTGHFGTEGFSLNTADMDVRSLLHGYSTVAWIRSMGAAINSAVVTSIETRQGGGDDRTYVFELAADLAYSDGSALTAKDYAFSVLLNGARAYQEIGGTPLNMNHIVGYEAYASGQADHISGVRLLSDTSFSLQISGEYLPFFYGLSMLNIMPYPASVIAPGNGVTDDGSGVRLSGALTAGELQKTLLDPATGYEFNPKVTTGPYKLEAYDSAAGQVTLVANAQYKGNYEGIKPHIERLVLRHVENDTLIGLLETGEVDLVNKISNPDTLTNGYKIADEGIIQMGDYLRTGLAYLSYACEEGPTASAKVRKAISMCLDVDALTTEVGGVVSRRVYGYYGLGQWMAMYTSDGGDGTSAVNMPDELTKLAVQKDLQAAKALLVEDGWTLNASGQPFTEGTDTVRYRQAGDALEALVIRWAKTTPSKVADMIEQALAPAMAEIGMQLEVTPMAFEDMLPYLYREKPRTYNMFYLATNFSYVFDPYYDFHVEDLYQGVTNTTGLRDAKLMEKALEMRETDPMDMGGYAEKWLAFQRYFVEVMPMTPLYSSVYFDFYTNKLKGYEINAHPGWGHAILYAYLEQ